MGLIGETLKNLTIKTHTNMKKKCPSCGNRKTQKHGRIMSKSEGRKQRYFCNDCGSTFY